jgi:hypothetical protein
MRAGFWGLTIVAFLAVAGCDTEFGRVRGLNAPEDVGPLPADYREQATAWTREKIGQPDAAVTVGNPGGEVAYCNVGVIGSHFGWRVPVIYKAKEGCGDCEGNDTMYLWFGHGKVERMSYFPNQC